MIYLNGYPVYFNSFPNKEMYADMDVLRYAPKSKSNTIIFNFKDDKDIFHLMLVKDFVDETYPNMPTDLIMGYIPYSRMDRKENSRLFTLKSFAKIINNMNFSHVIVNEPHSEVSVALIDRVQVNNISSKLAIQAMCDLFGLSGCCWFSNDYKRMDASGKSDFCIDALFERAKESGVYLVFPDSGAEKRYSKQIDYSNILTCKKKRDFDTGKINKTIVEGVEDVKDCRVAIIVDDLSSRGGTFMGVANELRKNIPTLEKVILCVTHCENTIYMGHVFRENSPIDVVYTTRSIVIDPSMLNNCLESNDMLIMNNFPSIDEDENMDIFKERVHNIVKDKKLIIVDTRNFED